MSVEDEHGYMRESLASRDIAKEQPVTPSRYSWTLKGVPFDFYRLCETIGIDHHAQAHALKKVIRAGRGDKPAIQDIDEAIASLKRWKEMILEDRNKTS